MTSHPPEQVGSRLAAVRAGIREACRRSGRGENTVTLVAISKKVPLENIAAALRAGQVDFGENYVQEAERKFGMLGAGAPRSAFRLHLTGPLQRNKVSKAVGLFDVIHTVDRLELADEISRTAQRKGLVQSILIQVNVSGENSKSGVDPAELSELYRRACKLPGLELRGVMAIGRYVDESASRSERIADHMALKTLKDQLEGEGLAAPELSMGMSSDYELAVECGATLVRVGTAIFGER